jgi:hypothetical protein
MEYFGTDLDVAGHYRWNISGNKMIRLGIIFRDLPFNPEELNNHLQNGDVIFYQGGGYTVFGITGSCIDKRSGCKSLFWFKEILSKEEIIERIKLNTIAMKIINAMPFIINCPEFQIKLTK